MEAAWEKIGREIRERHLKEAKALSEKIAEEVRSFPPEVEFEVAVISYAVGHDHSLPYVIEYLRSDRPLSSQGREALALFFEGSLKRRGRPTDWKAHEAAKLAKVIYREWKEKNNCEGISSRNHSDSMKDKASEYAVEILSSEGCRPASNESLVEIVRVLMDRSKHRHK
jgi:hypothetical protein